MDKCKQRSMLTAYVTRSWNFKEQHVTT